MSREIHPAVREIAAEKEKKMTLEELFSVVTECTNIILLSSETGQKLAEYDGRNAIPLKYNGKHVVKAYLQGKYLAVEI